MIKRTQGKWKVVQNFICVPEESGMGLQLIAQMKGKPENVKGDACLMSASQDLYEAGKRALDILPTGPIKDALIEAILKADHGEDNG